MTPVAIDLARMPLNAHPRYPVVKPRLTKLHSGAWLCSGGNLGGTGWTPTDAYRTWYWHTTQQAQRPIVRGPASTAQGPSLADLVKGQR